MFRRIATRCQYYGSFLNPNLARAYLSLPRKQTASHQEHITAAIRWLYAAQDVFGTGGVARSYSIVYNPFFGRQGWIDCYPETTGYIIPTVFDYARYVGSAEAFDRAVRMADWECEVQMPSGAVQGGTVDAPPSPAIFNTGQVIFGWLRSFQETGKEQYLAAAIKAGDFLLASQDEDGAWRRNLGKYASDKMDSYTYNTRTAWAVLLLGLQSGKQRCREAAIRNVDYALSQQLPNGWFKSNCLSDPARPLLHTIAYALRGVLEIGMLLNNPTYIGAVMKAADALLMKQRQDGSLAARFDSGWAPAADYSCLTGNAQMGIVWGRLYQATGEKKYVHAMAKANHFLKSVQWLGTGNPGLDGGISGSYPLHGNYGRFEVLNWAVKFFIDSLMLESSIIQEQENSVSTDRSNLSLSARAL